MPAAAHAMDDVVRDAVALLLAGRELAGELGVLRELGQQLAQRHAGALDVASRVLEQGGQGLVDAHRRRL